LAYESSLAWEHQHWLSNSHPVAMSFLVCDPERVD
jgi:hypothetical protein